MEIHLASMENITCWAFRKLCLPATDSYKHIVFATEVIRNDSKGENLNVFGLNPHASENGKMGSEEADVIIPAIKEATSAGIFAAGPFPADGFFGSNARAQFDGVLAMYHDQGLAAFKALAFEDGVNFTAGLPIVRTSPDHGTAFDIAGQNTANPQSMRSAIYLAIDVYRTHQFFKEINENPLQVQNQNNTKRKPYGREAKDE
jgi:4-hydroxythreonine-4-phosphate dehydrogenase